MTEVRDMPSWRCHKVVRALKVSRIMPMELGGGATLYFEESSGYAPLPVSEVYMKKHCPIAPGYFVVYEDGYQSWSPVEAFEKGYVREILGQYHPNLEELAKRFSYHPPRGTQVDRYTSIRDQARLLGQHLQQRCPASRELSLAMTKLEEVVMWANAAIARNEEHAEECGKED
jgi:hypothetical protein